VLLTNLPGGPRFCSATDAANEQRGESARRAGPKRCSSCQNKALCVHSGKSTVLYFKQKSCKCGTHCLLQASSTPFQTWIRIRIWQGSLYLQTCSVAFLAVLLVSMHTWPWAQLGSELRAEHSIPDSGLILLLTPDTGGQKRWLQMATRNVTFKVRESDSL